MKTLILAVMMLVGSAWGQFTATATPTSSSGKVHFNAVGGGTAAATTTAVTPDTFCTCTRIVYNTLYNSSYGYLAGGNIGGSCSSPVSDSFDYTMDPNQNYEWYQGSEDQISCPGQPMQISYLQKPYYSPRRFAWEHTKYGGSSTNCVVSNGVTYCTQSQTPWCSNTTVPTLQVAAVVNAPLVTVAGIPNQPVPGYDHYGVCYWSTSLLYWECTSNNLSIRDMTYPNQKKSCAVLPPL